MIKITEIPSIKVVGETSLSIEFPFDEKVIKIIKEAGDSVWNKKLKIWELPTNKLSFLIDNLTYISDIEINLLPDIEKTKTLLNKNYKTTPFSYQEEGIQYIVDNKNILLLDQPGTGKTLQTIYAAQELKEKEGYGHCLVICGINSLKTNWEKEIHKHSELDCIIIGKQITKKGTVKYASIKERADQLYNKIDEFFVIINIESLRDNLVIDAILNSVNKWDMIVIDECHRVKDPGSIQGKNFLKLSKVGKSHLGLTGTLLVNEPMDSYVPLKFIGKEKGTWTNFKQFYCIYEQKFGHNQIVGYKNLDVLKEEIGECSIRRTKDRLGFQLPPKTILPEYIEMSDRQLKFYDDISKGVLDEVDRVEIKTTSLLGLVIRLRQASTCPSVLTTSIEIDSCKVKRAIELVDEIVGNGEKVVIFSTFKEPLNILKNILSKYNPLLGTGDISDDEVSQNIDKFQTDDKYKVFLGTFSKTSTGVTLNAASYMIMLDEPWTYALFEQATDRIHRINNVNPAFIYVLIAENTIDERVFSLVEKKKELSDDIIDDSLQREELLELIKGSKF